MQNEITRNFTSQLSEIAAALATTIDASEGSEVDYQSVAADLRLYSDVIESLIDAARALRTNNVTKATRSLNTAAAEWPIPSAPLRIVLPESLATAA